MFARLTRLCRSMKTTAPAAGPAPARASMYEPLEDRRLCSVSPVGPSSFSFGVNQTGVTDVTVPAVQQPGSTNIIAVLIGL